MNSVMMFLFTLLWLQITIEVYGHTNVCLTKECLRTGFQVNQSIHTPTNPCQNFYKYTCGDWISKSQKPPWELYWNHWTATTKLLNDRLKNILGEKSQNLHRANTFLNGCLNTKKDHIDDLILLVDVMGGWPIVNDNWKSSEYDWLFQITELTKLFNFHSILSITVDVDFQNTTQYAIYLDPPNLVLPKYMLAMAKDHISELLTYKTWISETLKYMYPKKKWRKRNMDEEIDKIIDFEINLAKLQVKSKLRRKYIRLKDLNAKTRNNWVEILNILFSDANIKITEIDFIYLTDYAYNLLVYMKKTHKSVIANYIMWTLVKELSRDTSDIMRNLNFFIDNRILGVHEDIPRDQECMSMVTKYFSPAVMPKYVEKYVSSDTLHTVTTMTENIKSQYIKLLKRNQWLSKDTKDQVIEKIKAIRFFIGFPDWLKDIDVINTLYKDVTITENHFSNVLQLRKNKIGLSLKKYRSRVEIIWPQNLFEVNAYYNILQNSICSLNKFVLVISIGLLEPPFFSRDRSKVFNYAALGSLIGHELSHALDTTGRKADKDGNIRRWWTAKDITMYSKQVECFESQYRRLDVNSERSLGENLADNVGLNISYNAFKDVRGKDRELIPFLESFSDEKLFFIGYSQMWCEVLQNEEILQEDEHSTVQIRVLAPLENNKDFLNSFGCENRKQKLCTLW